jgi:hypothetical protein
MSDQPRPNDVDHPDTVAAPAFDKEAARRRYRATMRGPYMRSLYVLLALVILAAWGLGIGAVFARDVERLPGHGLSVAPSRCVSCHAAPSANTPAMPHVAFPTCGFCHRQGPDR